MSPVAHGSGRDSAGPFILWGEALLDDPRTALSDILSGRGARGAQQRAEPEDFLADLMAHPAWQEQRTHLLEGLDAALLKWLETYVEWSPVRINRFGTRAYAARIADALRDRRSVAYEGHRTTPDAGSIHLGQPISRRALAR